MAVYISREIDARHLSSLPASVEVLDEDDDNPPVFVDDPGVTVHSIVSDDPEALEEAARSISAQGGGSGVIVQLADPRLLGTQPLLGAVARVAENGVDVVIRELRHSGAGA